MSHNPYEPTTEIEDPEPLEIPDRRPTIATFAAIIFFTIGGVTVFTGALLEGTGALVVAICCWAGGTGGVDE